MADSLGLLAVAVRPGRRDGCRLSSARPVRPICRLPDGTDLSGDGPSNDGRQWVDGLDRL